MIDVIQQFKKVISENGLTPPEVILTGSKFHHFSTNGKKGDTSGWYRLHLDGIPAGSFGCYRSGIIKTWCSKSRNEMTTEEWASHVRVLESMAKQKEEDAQNKVSKASIEAQEIWSNAKPADDDHPYLLAKSV